MELKYGVYLIYNMYSEEEEDSSVEDVTPREFKYTFDSLSEGVGQTKKQLMVEALKSILARIKLLMDVIATGEKPGIQNELIAIDSIANSLKDRLKDKEYAITEYDKMMVKDLEKRVEVIINRNREFYADKEEEEVIDLTTSSTCMACLKQADNT
jgi:hypothetical protein